VKTSAVVQASCPSCGPVEVSARAFSCGVDLRGTRRGLCQFTCPTCARLVFLGTAPVAADVLLDQGAHPFAGAAPFELLEVHRGEPLSWDDLLDFHLAVSATPSPQEEVVRVEDLSTR
jgi:predicted RNA-binding Zn-ribbon protein involved in translation (DUF1610 family)